MSDSPARSPHSRYVATITEALHTGLYDDPPDEAKIVAGKDALENLVEQLEDYKRAEQAWQRNFDLVTEQKKRILEQLEELRLIEEWYTRARKTLRDYLGHGDGIVSEAWQVVWRAKHFEEQLEAAERKAAAREVLAMKGAQWRRALQAIAFNARSFHKGEDGKERALDVIAGWAENPDLVPEGVGYPALRQEDA